MQNSTTIRRYDLDWLRVGAFGLLIFYHVGMFFVPWEWHIQNNVDVHWLWYPMRMLNQWRLPILFLISGMGTYYAMGKRNAFLFAWERFVRLFIPLVFGMLVVVPPQAYCELMANGTINESYFTFWTTKAWRWQYITWNHLWFLPYLLTYAWISIPLIGIMRRWPEAGLFKIIRTTASHPLKIFLWVIPFYLIEALVEPWFDETHAYVDDWFVMINSFAFFFAGCCLAFSGPSFFSNIAKHRRAYLYTAIIAFHVLIGYRMIFEDSYFVHFTEALMKVVNIWAWILMLMGYAAQYLNKKSEVLSYCNEAVYPFYILHQTITVVIGFLLMDLEIWWGWKAILMVVGTFAGAWLLYEPLIKRVPPLRILFGMKWKRRSY